MTPPEDEVFLVAEEDQVNVTLAMFLRWKDESKNLDVNWTHCHDELHNRPLSNARFLTDILHTAFDGYVYARNGMKIIEYILDEQVTNEIQSALEHYELTRSGLARDLIGAGHGELSDFKHILKLYLMAKKKIEPPEHLKDIIDKPIVTERISWVADRIDDINLRLLNAKLDQPIKSLFPLEIIRSESGKGADKRDIRYIPEFIDKAVTSIIEKGHSKGQAEMYSGETEETFKRAWRLFKFPALMEYMLDLTHWGYINGDERVKQTTGTRKDIDMNNKEYDEEIYNIEITLPAAQHKKIETLWELKDLPNPIIFSGFTYSKELWVDEDDAEE